MGIASLVRSLVCSFVEGNGIEFCEDGDMIRARARRMNDPYAIRGVTDDIDYIACTHFLEHHANPEEILSLWFSKLPVGGRLLLVLPHKRLYPGPGDPGNPVHKWVWDENDAIAAMNATGCKFSVVARGVDDGGSRSFFVVFEKIGPLDFKTSAAKLPRRMSRRVPYCIVIPYKDNLDMTRDCVRSIHVAGWKPKQIVLVNDGSVEALEDDDPVFAGLNVCLVSNEKNMGFPVSVNRGVAASDPSCSVIVLLNNDTVVHSGGDVQLLSPLMDTSVAMTGQQGGALGDAWQYAGNGNDYIEFYCAAIKRSVWNEFGGLDERFSPGYGEDSDFGIRLRRAGYTLRVVGDGVCTHLRNKTFGKSFKVHALIERNRGQLRQKHCKGDVLFVVASVHPSGGIKVIWNCAQALREAGYRTSALLTSNVAQWPDGPREWTEFYRLRTFGMTKPPLQKPDITVATFFTTWPAAANVGANRFMVGLVQSDEPRWGGESGGVDAAALQCFQMPGFKSVIVADYMYEFADKYGMDIVGKIENGVDSRVFYPTNVFGRAWDHSLLTIRKGHHVWFDGQAVADEAAGILAQRYADFKYIILGANEGWPRWKPPACAYKWQQSYNEDEVCDIYNSVGAYVIPSVIEGSSLTALEAMSCGTPLVCTKIASDATVHGKNALIVPDRDPIAIADAVSRIFDDAELRTSLHHEGMRTAFTRTHERQRQQFAEIVSNLERG